MKNLIKKYYAELTGLFVFFVYLFTLAPSVVQIDSGELAAVQYNAGIAHPTGYPLFTVLGYLFLRIPIPSSIIFKANLLSAVYCAAGVIFLIKTAYIILSNPYNKTQTHIISKKGKDKKAGHQSHLWYADESVKITASVFSGLLTAFSLTFWLQSTSVEVYSLHIMLMSLIIYYLLKAFFFVPDERTQSSTKSWIIFSAFLALGFTNHMTTLLIIPGAAILFFIKEKFTKDSFRKLIYALPVFSGILIAVYSYLPISASQNPILNWSNPINWENFWRHFTGAQYQVWLFSSSESAKKHFLDFFSNLPSQFAYIGLISVLIGVIYSIRKSKQIFIFLAAAFLFTVFYSVNYDIVDIDTYFLLAYISLGLISAFGFVKLFEFFKAKNIEIKISVMIITISLLIQFFTVYPKADQSGIYVYEDYTRSLLNSVDKKSIVFSYQWDYFISASYYFQFVENFRKDVIVIDKELLRRSWYFDQIERNHPETLSGIKNEVKLFRDALQPFERNESHNAGLLEQYYQDIMQKLITTNFEKHPYYIGPELVDNELRQGIFKIPEGYQIVPQLFLYKVTKGDEYVPAPDPDFNIRFPEEGTRYTDIIRKMIAGVLVNRAIYEVKFNKLERAKIYLNKIAMEFPEQPVPAQLRSLIAN